MLLGPAPGLAGQFRTWRERMLLLPLEPLDVEPRRDRRPQGGPQRPQVIAGGASCIWPLRHGAAHDASEALRFDTGQVAHVARHPADLPRSEPRLLCGPAELILEEVVQS